MLKKFISFVTSLVNMILYLYIFINTYIRCSEELIILVKD